MWVLVGEGFLGDRGGVEGICRGVGVVVEEWEMESMGLGRVVGDEDKDFMVGDERGLTRG